MPETHIIAFLYPASGKADRLKELLKGMIKDVHSKEDYTLRYMATEQVEAEGDPAIVMIETYKSQEATAQHTSEPHFKELFGKFEKEGLFAKAPFLAKSQTIAGFDLDHKLI